MPEQTSHNPQQIRTQRLQLVAVTAELARLQIEDRDAFFRTIDVMPEVTWPPELMDGDALHWLQETANADAAITGWMLWIFIWPGAGGQAGRLVGAGGFKGEPNTDGEVEIGYSMLISFREQGLATEAVEGLLGWSERDPRVKRIIAKTLPHLAASRRVLEKTGFVEKGEELDEGRTLIRYEREGRNAKAA